MGYRNYSVANGFVVDKLGNGDFQTIGAAIIAAKSGYTIFLRTGIYSEVINLKAGVNLTAFEGDGINGNVTILGNVTAAYTGICTLSGIQLQTTGSNPCLSITG